MMRKYSDMKAVIIHRNSATSHGLALILEKYGDFDVLAEVSDVDAGVSVVLEKKPDLTVVDSEFPGLDLEEIITLIKRSLPETSGGRVDRFRRLVPTSKHRSGRERRRSSQ